MIVRCVYRHLLESEDPSQILPAWLTAAEPKPELSDKLASLKLASLSNGHAA